MELFGTATLAKFAGKHDQARKPLQRFMKLVQSAAWPHFPAIKEQFPAADYASETGTVIFNIGGNKYRLIARVDFKRQTLYVEKALTHQEYEREKL